MIVTFAAMNESTKKGISCGMKFYTPPGIGKKIGRSRVSVWAAIKRLGIKPSGELNGKRCVYTEKDLEIISKSLRRPNATLASE